MKHLSPVWFAAPMGTAGLSLAWARAAAWMGEWAVALSMALGVLAALIFMGLVVALGLRHQAHPRALDEDLRHPIRHPFIAAVPVSMLLLAAVATAHGITHWAIAAFWGMASMWQMALTVWVLARWWRGPTTGGLQWPGVTPVLLIPVVGNVVAPLAGLPLGQAEWSMAQLGIGLLFWPVVLTLIGVRLAIHGPWPPRMGGAAAILVAPPAVIGSVVISLEAPAALAWICWGMALFCAVWAVADVRRLMTQPFAITHWALGFPTAALAALTLRLGAPGQSDLPPPQWATVLAMLLLVLASLVWAGLALSTFRGLRQGRLLVPESVPLVAAAEADAGPGGH